MHDVERNVQQYKRRELKNLVFCDVCFDCSRWMCIFQRLFDSNDVIKKTYLENLDCKSHGTS